jgi:orotate phosphoribosyltransferase
VSLASARFIFGEKERNVTDFCADSEIDDDADFDVVAGPATGKKTKTSVAIAAIEKIFL